MPSASAGDAGDAAIENAALDLLTYVHLARHDLRAALAALDAERR